MKQSRKGWYANRRPRALIPAETRFWRHVLIVPGIDCWLWVGANDGRFGYGRFVPQAVRALKQKQVTAHKFSYEMHFGPVPAGLCVLHICDVPKCVRPTHLRLGTAADNVLDCKAKGRNRGAEPGKNYNAKLNEDAVRDIAGSKEYDFILAARYGVSRSVISNVRCGKTWKHVAR